MKEDTKEIKNIIKNKQFSGILIALILLTGILFSLTAAAACHYRHPEERCCIPCDPCRYFCPRRNFIVAKYYNTVLDLISNKVYVARNTVEPAEYLDLH